MAEIRRLLAEIAQTLKERPQDRLSDLLVLSDEQLSRYLGGILRVEKIFPVFAEPAGSAEGETAVCQCALKIIIDDCPLENVSGADRHAPGVVIQVVCLG